MPLKTTSILGFNFLNTTQSNFLDLLHHDILNHENRFVVTANPEIIMYAQKDPLYASIIRSADYLVPDGIGIIKASKFTNHPMAERITGYDLFTQLLDWSNSQQLKVYLLGAKPEVIKKVVAKIHRTLPKIKIVGYHDGYFKSDDCIITEIKASQPDLVFIATGFPKQEEFIHQYRHLCPALWMGIGGSFDVYAEIVERAPIFWQKHNIEWLYRLITDPRRIKRQIVLPIFMFKAFKARQKKEGRD